jgi:hypothetical protein
MVSSVLGCKQYKYFHKRKTQNFVFLSKCRSIISGLGVIRRSFSGHGADSREPEIPHASVFPSQTKENFQKNSYSENGSRGNIQIRSEVIIPPEPLDLRAGVPVNDIAFLVLERPGDHDEDVPFADPDLFLYLALDPAHPGHPVKAADPDMVCAHHQFGTPEHLTVPFLGQFHPDDLVARRCSRFMVCQYNLSFLILRLFIASLLVFLENIFNPAQKDGKPA